MHTPFCGPRGATQLFARKRKSPKHLPVHARNKLPARHAVGHRRGPPAVIGAKPVKGAACFRVDRRKIVLTLTPQGQSILNTAQQGTLDQIEEWIESLSPAERATILQSMQILAQVFSGVEPSAQAR